MSGDCEPAAVVVDGETCPPHCCCCGIGEACCDCGALREPDWANAATCIENAEIAFGDSTESEDGPVDTVISSGDLGVLIGLAQWALATREGSA